MRIPPTLFVAGLGRCGTTMLMTMLDAGGFPVTGPRPSYESAEHWRRGRPDIPWLREQAGRAVKWIDPTLALDTPSQLYAPPVVILLTRRARQQAKSQAKLLGLPLDRKGENRLKASIERDTKRMTRELGKVAHIATVSFESVVANPNGTATMLAGLIADHFGRSFDAKTAARVVIERGENCLPHLEMERTILPVLAADMPSPAQTT